jgi:hypothetical protein
MAPLPNFYSMPARVLFVSVAICFVAPMMLDGNSVNGFVFTESNAAVAASAARRSSARKTKSRLHVVVGGRGGRPSFTSPVVEARETLLSLLQSGEKENSPALTPHLNALTRAYSESKIDARFSKEPISFCGEWVNANIPEFPGQVDVTDEGLPVYTVGRLTFQHIPSNVNCVVTKMMQTIRPIPSHESSPPLMSIPEELRRDYRFNRRHLRTNTIDTFFRIPDSPLKGILRMEGYALPCTVHTNRWNKWFVGGLCIPLEEDEATTVDRAAWERVFGKSDLSYSLPSPVVAHQTVVYLDDFFRIGIGNRGTSVLLIKQKSY